VRDGIPCRMKPPSAVGADLTRSIPVNRIVPKEANTKDENSPTQMHCAAWVRDYRRWKKVGRVSGEVAYATPSNDDLCRGSGRSC